MSIGLQQARDSIGSEPDKFPIILREYENLKLYITTKTSINSSVEDFVVGDSTFGLINLAVVGDTTSGFATHSIKNQNNLYYENFDEDSFIDTSNSTGTLEVGYYDLTYT